MDQLKESAAPTLEMETADAISAGTAPHEGNHFLQENQIIKVDNEHFFNEIMGKVRIKHAPPHKAANAIPFVLEEVKAMTNYLISANDRFMWYNGKYWREIPDKTVGLFLRGFALKLGIASEVVKPVWGVDALIKQGHLDLNVAIRPQNKLFNFENGVYDIETDVFREHRAEDYLMYILPYNYAPNVISELWQKSLDRVLPNKIVQTLFQQAIGALIARMNTEKIPFLIGDGCNGKSLVLNTLSNAMGSSNVSRVSLDNILDTSGKGVAMVDGKLLNISNETPQKVGSEELLKSYVSGESMKAKKLYKDEYETKNYARSVVAGNNLPITGDFSCGLYRRFLFIPFDEVIQKNEMDIHLEDKLRNELAGVMNWILEGIRIMKKEGKFIQCEESDNVLKQFRLESDSVAMYLQEQSYEPSVSDYSKKLLSDVMKEYGEYCLNNGFFKANSVTLSRRLKKLGYRVAKSNQNKVFVWLEVKNTPAEPETYLPF